MDRALALSHKIDQLRQASAVRDQHWLMVKAVRDGDANRVFADHYSEDWPAPMTANQIDTIARDVAESMAPMPSLNCSSGSMVSDAARKFADKKTKIVTYYFQYSRVALQHLSGADHYASYGVEVAYLQPDFDAKCPRITIEEPLGGYPEYDRHGNVLSYSRVWKKTRNDVAAMFPEHAPQILNGSMFGTSDQEVELARHCDDKAVTLLLIGEQPMLLAKVENKLGKPWVVTARRPSHRDPNTGAAKGQFDDVMWAQAAHDFMTRLTLEAAEKAVRAPIRVPRDMTDLPLGPDAIVPTDGVIERVRLEVPQAAFVQANVLADEVRKGSRYSSARSGELDASIITGQGVEALAGSFNTQLAAAQTVFTEFFKDIAALCFEIDETYWPNTKKQIKGHVDGGSPFSVEYTPSKDVAGDYSVDVSYGLGLDPARAVVSLLQLQAANAISADTLQRLLNLKLDVGEEQKKVLVEKLREGGVQGVLAYVQAIPTMALQGQNPVMLLQQLAAVIKAVEKGRPVEDAIAEAFTPPEAEEPEPAPAGAVPGAEAGGAPQGLMPNGLPFGVAQGQAGMAPGSRPDLQSFLSGFSPAGNPMQGVATLRRRRV